MSAVPSRLALLTAVLGLVGLRTAAAQTTVVQNPNGGTQVTIQGDGSGNTFVFTQGVAGPVVDGAPQVIVGGTTFGGPLPPRDQQAAPAVGTSRLRGRVIAADSGGPLRRAVVRLNAPGVREQRSTTTDADGHYEFTQLPAATYTVTATRSGYVQTGYRQPRPNAAPRPVTLGERQTLDRIDIALPPGGVITGRVVDEYGEPVSDVMVSAQRQQYVNGTRRPMPAGAPSTSNDIGEFRLYGLSPGEYYLAATVRAQSNPFEISSDRTGYGLTYYPSAPDPASAQRVVVRGGDAVSNIVIALAPARVSRVSGVVADADGRLARGGAVMAMPREAIGPPSATTPVRQDGTFVFTALPPGDYTLRSMPAGPGAGAMAFATATISVNGSDLSNVVLQPQSQVTISGRLTGDPAVLARIRPATTRIVATPAGPMMFNGPSGAPTALRDDLSFDLPAFPGQVMLRATGLTDVAIRAVRLNGRDVTRGVEVPQGAPVSDLELEVAPATAHIVVVATTARDEAVPDRDIVIFPQDESQWGLLMPGHGGTGRTDEQGQYQSVPLLAGAYYVADTDPLEPGEANDPEVLAALRARARRVAVGEGETANVRFRTDGR
ncbi:MAG TPA: carboxypeptidase-like regulatory domain-containing protein [Vicinamibacterales bacterium]|nr:carboxypeptidase-like regulatory domain-containing protein [Vicinamibacterales bacterium]